MPFDNTILVVAYTIFTAIGVRLLYRHSRSNPAFWFLLFQWVIAYGTLVKVDLTHPSDRTYAFMFILAIVMFVLGAIVILFLCDVDSHADRFWVEKPSNDRKLTQFFIAGLVVLSIGITYIYYNAVGYNLFFDIIFQRSVEDFTSARLAAYSGENYYAPGYANQFKNALLPLCWSVISSWAYFSGRKKHFRILLLTGIPLLLAALLGTGQRAFLIYAFLGFVFGLSSLRKIPKKYFVIGGLSIVFFFGILSFFLGRITDLTVADVFQQLYERVLINEQSEAIIAFRYIDKLEMTWYSEWLEGFIGLTPWHKGSTLQHDVFKLIHGTTRGTAAVTTVASVYYNGGILGVITVYFFMGVSYMLLYVRFVSGPRTILRCLGYGAVFFYLAFFVSGPPVALINKGMLSFILVLVIRKISITLLPKADSMPTLKPGLSQT